MTAAKPGLAERHDLARDDVRVDQRGAELDEHRADQRLAAGDAAGQPDDETRPNLTSSAM